MSDFLSKILGSSMSEEELYRSYFRQELWTIKEFASLMAGITPEKFEELYSRKDNSGTAKEYAQYKHALMIYDKFLEDVEKKIELKEFYLAKGVSLTPWKFIRWVSTNQVPVKHRFADSLPLHLLEILIEFSPLDVGVKTTPKWHRNYHKVFYLKNAELIMEASNKKMTRQEIYEHPQMEYIRRTFKDINGEQVTYTKRTIINSWLPKIDPRKRGRPRKLKRKTTKNTSS